MIAEVVELDLLPAEPAESRRDIVYDYSDAPTIERFSECRKFIRALMGPFGSGKSSGCVIELVQWAARQRAWSRASSAGRIEMVRSSRFAVVRNTYRQLADTSIKTFLEWLPDGVFGRYVKNEHTYYLRMPLDDGTIVESEILFRALDRPEHVSNLLSLELTGAWLNEARELPYAIVEAVQGRVDRYPKRDKGGSVDPGIILDTNPPDDDSWFYTLFEQLRPDNAEIFKQPGGRDSKAENRRNLSPTYYENLAMGKGADFIRVYVDGLYGFVKTGRPVYGDDYNDGLHCQEVEPVAGRIIELGWDFGLTPACIFTQRLPDGRWLVFDELCGEYIGLSTFADIVLKMLEERYPGFTHVSFGDPSGNASSAQSEDKAERTCFDILQGKGFVIENGMQNPTIRIESVRYPLTHMADAAPQFVLHPRCQMVRKGFAGKYAFKRVQVTGSAERYHNEPDKNEYSHPHDALQYVATKVFANVVRGRMSDEEADARADQAIKRHNERLATLARAANPLGRR